MGCKLLHNSQTVRSIGWIPIATSLFVLAVFFFGGASRSDEFSQYFVRFSSAVLLFALALYGRRMVDGFPYKILLLFCALAAILLVQLVPLPGGVWRYLPGREVFADVDILIHGSPLWRPISLSPLATINSLMSLVVPGTAIFLCAQFRSFHVNAIMICMAIVITISAIICIIQISGLKWPTPYQIVATEPVFGIFANRNNQSLLLAIGIPILGYFARLKGQSSTRQYAVHLLCLAGIMMFISLIFIIGSRTGVIFALVGTVGALAIMHREKNGTWPIKSNRLRFFSRLSFAAIVLTVLVFLALNPQAESFERFYRFSVIQDYRLVLLPDFFALAWKYFPLGSGGGTFAAAYRLDEGVASLGPKFLNHAHNDFVEVLIEFGFLGGVLLIFLTAWLISSVRSIWFTECFLDDVHLSGRVMSVVGLLLLIASIVDYPLRTPIFQTLAVFCIWFLWLPSTVRRL